MGTLRDEMSKVLNEWEKQDQQIETTSQEKTMENHETKDVSTTQKLINIIAANPGITSKGVYKFVEENHPEIIIGNVSSMLTQLASRYVLSREQSGEVVNGKTIYAYTVIPEADRKPMREEAERKLREAQARAEKARAVKAAKKAAREQLDKMLAEREQQEERTGLSDLLPEKVQVPARLKRFENMEPITKPTWSAKETLDGLSVLQARELYDELKKIFGG